MSSPSGSGAAQEPAPRFVTASNNSFAVGSVENFYFQPAAEANTSATVLPIEAIVDDRPPFVGRHRELLQIADALGVADLPSADVAVVTGAPGVGKSALVEHFARQAYSSGIFFKVLHVNLDGYVEDEAKRVQPDMVFAPLLESLATGSGEGAISTPIRDRQYHEVLNSLGRDDKPVLLWLDNASDRDQFDRLRPVHPLHKVIVTTRETFSHIPNRQVVEVDLFDAGTSRELLEAAVQDRHPGDCRLASDDAATSNLVVACGGLPLALQIVAALLAEEPERPVTALVNDLSEENRLTTLHYSADRSVRLAISLSYRRLQPSLQRLFRLLSVIPGRDIGLEAASWLVDATASTVRSELRRLVRSNLVQQRVYDRWTMHDLIALHAAELCAESIHQDEKRRAFRRVVEGYWPKIEAAAHWLTTSPSVGGATEWASPHAAAAWFEAERPTLTAIAVCIVDIPEYRQLALVFGLALADVLKPLHHYRIDDYYAVAAATASLARFSLETQCSADSRAALSALNLYVGALCGRGEFLNAIAFAEYALKMSERLGDLTAAAGARSNMGVALQGMGRIDEAIKQYSEVVEASRRSVPLTRDDHILIRNNEAIALNNIGSALAVDKRYEEAIPYLYQATVVRAELGSVPGLASSMLQLGGAAFQLGRERGDSDLLEKAVDVLRCVFESHSEHGNRSAQSYAAMYLGGALCELGNAKEGVPYLELALGFFEDYGQIGIAGRIRAELMLHPRM